MRSANVSRYVSNDPLGDTQNDAIMAQQASANGDHRQVLNLIKNVNVTT